MIRRESMLNNPLGLKLAGLNSIEAVKKALKTGIEKVFSEKIAEAADGSGGFGKIV